MKGNEMSSKVAKLSEFREEREQEEQAKANESARRRLKALGFPEDFNYEMLICDVEECLFSNPDPE